MKKIFIIFFILIFSLLFANASYIDELNNKEKSQVVYFKTTTCPYCKIVSDWIDSEIENKYENIDIIRVDLDTTKNYEMVQEFYRNYEVPVEKQNKVPIIFIADTYYFGPSEIQENLESKILEINQTKTLLKKIEVSNKQEINLAQIIGLALVDAINPCELAVLIILMTAILTRYPKNKRKALFVGLSFTLGIFIVYFIFGLLLRELFTIISSNVSLLESNFFIILGIISIIIGILNLKDGLNYGAGGFIMEVPQAWRPKMKKIIEGTTSPIGAFFVGVVIAFFLTPCTAGPYLVFSGIISQISILEAMPYLLLYMLIFVSPMLAITLIAYFGFAKIEDMGEWRERNISKLHLVAGALMMLIGIWLILFALGFI